jgi:hypothetical protein
MDQIFTTIISSAIVSGIVSIIASYFFENRKYLKEKRFSTYTNFLDQLDRAIPAEAMGKLKGDDLREAVRIESAKIERYLWQIKLISDNELILKKSENIFDLYGKLSEIADSLTSDDKDKKITSVFHKINSEREILLYEMNKDINKLF